MPRIPPAELESHPSKYEAEQHRDNERIRRGQDDGIGDWEGGKQAASAQN